MLRALSTLFCLFFLGAVEVKAQTVYSNNFKQDSTGQWFANVEPGLYSSLKWHKSNHGRPKWLSKFFSATHDGMIRSEGPWWRDANHTAPGIGWLQIIAFSYWKGFEMPTRKANDWQNGEVPKTAFALGSADRPIDLVGATVKVRVRGDISKAPAGSWLGVWFTADATDAIENRPVRAHYANIANPIPLHPTEWTNIEFKLRPYDTDWVCMGQQPTSRHVYGCAKSVRDVLGSVNYNFGFLLFNGHKRPDGPVDGFVEFDKIKIVRNTEAY